MKNLIGLNQQQTIEIVQLLNKLLADYQVYYQNLRGFHWNIKGKHFFELHLKFEELYNDAQLKIDLVAERILTLGGVPLHTFEQYLKTSTVVVAKEVHEDVVAITKLTTALQEIILVEREILTLSANAEDEGTNTLMSDFITTQEKLLWMLTAWLG